MEKQEILAIIEQQIADHVRHNTTWKDLQGKEEFFNLLSFVFKNNMDEDDVYAIYVHLRREKLKNHAN